MTTPNDPLYFPRTELANRLVISLLDGIANAFTLFAPRRMGKTEFLLKDVTPVAQEQGFKVFYFSFMDVDNDTIAMRFQQSLTRFAAETTTKEKAKKLLSSIDKISFMGASISRKSEGVALTVSDIIALLAEAKQPILLLLDEAQELARTSEASGLVRSLRTGLDIHKDQIKVIFTGSSMTGLQAMFNDSKAPFFHFAHHIDFPVLGRNFSDYLATIIESRTGKAIDQEQLFSAFEQMNFTPMYLRAVAQDMILDPDLSLPVAVDRRLEQQSDAGSYQALWDSLATIDRLLLLRLVAGETVLFGKENLAALTRSLAKPVSASQVQKALGRLSDKEIISKDLHGQWIITQQAFKIWMEQSSQ